MAFPIIPANWDPELVMAMSALAPEDQQEALVFWRTVAPRLYQLLLEALPVEGFGFPEGVDEWEQVILEDGFEDLGVPGAEALAAQGDRYRRALGLGLVIFFSLQTLTYTKQDGTPVSDATLRYLLNSVTTSGRTNVLNLTNQLRDGNITVDVWRQGMADHIRRLHTTTGTMASGGLYNLGPDRLSLIEQSIATQLQYLDRRAQAILSGEQLLDGTLLRRALMYNESARGAFYALELRLMSLQYDEYRNVITAAESCKGGRSCPGETAKGWVPIGALTPIGQRNCFSNCKCYFEYRNSTTGEVRGGE